MTKKVKPGAEAPSAGTVVPQQQWGRQSVGALVGMFVMLVIVRLVGPRVGWEPARPGSVILWGGIIGSMISSFDALVYAGSRLTQHGQRQVPPWINFIVALLSLTIFIGVIAGLVYLLRQLFMQLF
ncbi:MAG: hypothetical protein JXA33_20360 [Anaerolineae bacterium]|nr:hypothetical protein [Anaerolineae bacterium]